MSSLHRSTTTALRGALHLRLPAHTVLSVTRLAQTASFLNAQTTTPSRNFSSSRSTQSGGHDSHYDPPSGWLWGVPPGQKAEKEGWEGIWYWGFYGSLGLAVVAYAFKPDTNIETWALEEAKRRLQAEGTLPEDE